MKIKNQKLFIFISIFIYLFLQIGFFVSFIVILSANKDDVLQINRKTFAIPLFFVFSIVFSLIFSSFLYWKYKKTSDRFYLKFSYLFITWSIISQMILFQVIIAIIFAFKFWSREKNGLNTNNNENRILKNSLIFRPVTNLIIILTIVGFAIGWTILKLNDNWFLFFVMGAFISQIFLRMIINQVIDWTIAHKEKSSNWKIIFCLIIATTLGQFWYPIQLVKNDNQDLYQAKTPNEQWDAYTIKERNQLLISKISGLIISAIGSALFIATAILLMKNFALEYQGKEPMFSTQLIALMASQIVLGFINGVIILTSKYRNKIVFGILTTFISFIGLFFWIFAKLDQENKGVDQFNFYW